MLTLTEYLNLRGQQIRKVLIEQLKQKTKSNDPRLLLQHSDGIRVIDALQELITQLEATPDNYGPAFFLIYDEAVHLNTV